MDQLRSTMLLNFASACDAALSYVEQIRSSANWQTFNQVRTLAMLQCRELGCDHGALRLVQVSAA
jgi:hypothetical protein